MAVFAVKVETIAVASMLQVEHVAQRRPLFQTLANLATYAVARLHDPLAYGRSATVEAVAYLLHAMTMVEATREAVYHIMLRAKAPLGVDSRAIILAYIVLGDYLGTLRCQQRQRLTAHLGKVLGRSKPLASLNIYTNDTEDAIATLCHLLHGHSTHLIDTLRGVELYGAHNLNAVPLLVGISCRDATLSERYAACCIYGTSRAAALDALSKAVVVVAIYIHAHAYAIHAIGLDDVTLNAVDVSAEHAVGRDET